MQDLCTSRCQGVCSGSVGAGGPMRRGQRAPTRPACLLVHTCWHWVPPRSCVAIVAVAFSCGAQSVIRSLRRREVPAHGNYSTGRHQVLTDHHWHRSSVRRRMHLSAEVWRSELRRGCALKDNQSSEDRPPLPLSPSPPLHSRRAARRRRCGVGLVPPRAARLLYAFYTSV